MKVLQEKSNLSHCLLCVLEITFQPFLLIYPTHFKRWNTYCKVRKRLLGERKNKFFRMALLFSVHSPDPFFFFLAYFTSFNLSSLFLSFCPQCFRMLCFFFLGVSSSSLSEELSVMSHMYLFYFPFSVNSFKTWWIFLQRSCGIHYCN